MKCENCGHELPEGSEVCGFCDVVAEETPVAEEILEPAAIAEKAEKTCGKEAQPKKKNNILVIVLAASAGLALLAVLAGAILYGIGINPVELLKHRDNDLLAKDNYYVSEDKARKNVDRVVATVADEELTLGELQIYYWEAVFNFIDQNYYYLSYYGLDLYTPLNEQACTMVEGLTWQQYFLDIALGTWHRYTTLSMIAEEENYQVDAEMQTFFDDLPESMQSSATQYGFDTAVAWLESNCGPGVSEEGYIEYITAYYMGTFYLSDNEALMEVTDEDVETYFAENEEALAQLGITKDMGKYYDVRHILIEATGSSVDENGNVVITEEDWAACMEEAQKILDEWKETDGTEEGFAEYAAQYSADPGSSDNGGLYADLTADTSFIQNFKDWYLAEGRQPGDTGLVQNTQSSVQGYHIMYFSASREMWNIAVSEELLADRISDVIDEAMARFPMEVNYKKITLGDQAIVQ